MERNKSQHARLMELHRLIRAGRYPNCLTFSAEWGVSQKTIQRDVDYLRDQCGAPIAYSRERKGFYYTDNTWLLPSILLSEGELLALLLASRALEQYAGTPVAAHLDRVFGKIAELLPGKISLRPELLYNRFSFRGPPAKPITENIWVAVVQSLIHQHVLNVIYRPFEAVTLTGKTSRICPWHIANLQGEWYVFGVHEGYHDVRQFALARIEQATVTKRHFKVPVDYDPEKRLDAAFARYAGDGQTQTVRLLFDKEIANWITERQWHPRQTLKHRKTGDIELEFPAKGLYEVQRWVLSWGSLVSVLEPAELKTCVQNEINAMAGQIGDRVQ